MAISTIHSQSNTVIDTDDSEYDFSMDSDLSSQNKIKFNNKNQKDIDVEARNSFIDLGNNYFQCKTCTVAIKIVNNSVSNLKSHLGRKHKLTEFLTMSQVRHLNKEAKSKPLISKQEKSKLDEMALKAIINDSQAFNIFSKPGMKKFIENLKPGYKPFSRKTAVGRLKKKDLFFILTINDIC